MDESLANLAPEVLEERVEVLRLRLELLGMANKLSRVEKPQLIRQMRLTKARILTLLRILSLNKKV